jgi:ADP-ribose pyrophosphatase YjhB (NUDIX family)
MLLGVNTAVFKDGRVLLTRREDFHVWCLPGGSVDDGESVAQAAMREVTEETGLEVRLTRMVGIYSRPGWIEGGYHIVVFTAEQIGGQLEPAPREVVEIEFFGIDALPDRMLIGQRERILDAAAGIGGSAAVSESITYPRGMPAPRFELYARRDASGLARDDFYHQVFGPHEAQASTAEVKGHRIERSGS